MKTTWVLLVISLLLVSISLSMVVGSDVPQREADYTAGNYYFYIYGQHTCPHCRAMTKFLTESYGDKHVFFCDLLSGRECYSNFMDLYNKGLPGYVPAIFIVYNCTVSEVVIGELENKTFFDNLLRTNDGDKVPVYMVGEGVVGYLEISDHKAFIARYLRFNGYCSLPNGSGGEPVYGVVLRDFSYLLLPLIVLSLMDSVNPCTLTLYFTFITTLISLKKSLSPAILYLVIVYAGYLLLGLGIWALSGIVPVQALLFLAAVVAIYNIVDAGKRYKEGLKCGVCGKLGFLDRIAGNPYLVSLLLSLISVTVLLPCTSGPLMVFVSLLRGYPYIVTTLALMLYNVLFVFPMILILLAGAYLRKKKLIADFITQHAPLLEFLSGIVLLLIIIMLLV